MSGGDRRGADSARTVIRPPDPLVREGALAAAAGPQLELGQSAARAPRPDAAGLAADACRLAEAFEAETLRAGLSRSAASQHLRILRDAGLVHVRVDANRRLYRADLERLGALRAALDDFWGVGLAELKRTVETGAARRAQRRSAG